MTQKVNEHKFMCRKLKCGKDKCTRNLKCEKCK